MPVEQPKSAPRGQRIRDLRLGRGMTQEKLARMANVDVKTICRAERGEGALRPETLLDIATALDVPIDGALVTPGSKTFSWQANVGCPESYDGDELQIMEFVICRSIEYGRDLGRESFGGFPAVRKCAG